MATDERHIALPQLYGAPAYARPPAAVEGKPRPFDPDGLPLEVERTDAERELAASLSAYAYGTRSTDGGASSRNGSGLHPRSFSVRSIKGKLLRGS